MRVLVCGGRDFVDREFLYHVLDGHCARADQLICGGARGADDLAFMWACDRRIPAERFMADWERHGKRGGPIRNQRMLDEGKPDVVIAFPGGRGTADMVRRAEKAGVKVVRVVG